MGTESEVRDSVLQASPKVKALLRRLHDENSRQENSYQRLWYKITFTVHCLWNLTSRESWNQYNDLHCGDQLLSHSREKCELIYMLACLNNTKSAVECGTSFGVSTTYLALAIARNTCNRRHEADGVITMEKNASKIASAKRIWAEAGPEIEEWITPLEGDLLQLLEKESVLPATVDLLFLDAWTSLALPALRLVLPRLRHGSLVFADKTGAGKLLYQDLLEFVHDPINGFMSATIPFSDGFEVMVYQPKRAS